MVVMVMAKCRSNIGTIAVTRCVNSRFVKNTAIQFYIYDAPMSGTDPGFSVKWASTFVRVVQQATKARSFAGRGGQAPVEGT